MKLYKDHVKDPLVRKISKEVKLPLSDEDEQLVKDMIKHIDDSKLPGSKDREGIGLAAVQVGHLKRMFYINVELDKGRVFREFLINPVLIGEGATLCAFEQGEGCLSVDEKNRQDLEGLVHRRYKVIVKGYSYFQKKEVEITKTGIEAIVLQHELDHLDGKLFYDRIDQERPWDLKGNEEII